MAASFAIIPPTIMVLGCNFVPISLHPLSKSLAPYTIFDIWLQYNAPAHIWHGSKVT